MIAADGARELGDDLRVLVHEGERAIDDVDDVVQVHQQQGLATLAQRFDVKLEPGQTVVPDATFTLRPRNGIRMRLRRRTPARAPAGTGEPARA